jgi:hypothetical protein
MDNRCPGHRVTKATPVASHSGGTIAHPAGSKSIRRNCDVSPIALLVDHENSIHTDHSWVRLIRQSQKSRFVTRRQARSPLGRWLRVVPQYKEI